MQRERLTNFPLNHVHNKRLKLWIEAKEDFTLLWGINGSKTKEWLLAVYDAKTSGLVPRIGPKKQGGRNV